MSNPHDPQTAPVILIVDDNPSDRVLAERTLRQALPGAQFHLAGDAPALAQALQRDWSVVITDYHLGFGSGLDVLKQVKARDPHCPVILFTLTGSEEIAVSAMKAGADDYILKTPKRLPLLVSAVQRAIQRAQERASRQEAETRYRDLFDRMPIGLFRTSEDYTLRQVNAAMAHLLGFDDANNVVGRNVSSFLPVQAELRNLIHALRAGEPVNGAHLTLRRADGQDVCVELHVRATRDASGQVSGLEGSAQDVTRRVQAERELQNMNATLERRVEARTAELAELNQELEAFSYSVSHDLSAPVRHIDAYTRLLLKDLEGPTRGERATLYAGRILTATQRMAALIEGLLVFARTNRQELHFKQVDLNALLSAARQDLQDEEAERRVEWHVQSLPAVRGDAAALRQVLVNLLGNALKYTRPRDVARIEVACEATPDEYIIRVRDNGVGFDARYAQKLFGVFQRLHRQDEFEGTGVGLASVRRTVERHGGRVWAQSQPGEGATFFVALPRI